MINENTLHLNYQYPYRKYSGKRRSLRGCQTYYSLRVYRAAYHTSSAACHISNAEYRTPLVMWDARIQNPVAEQQLPEKNYNVVD